MNIYNEILKDVKIPYFCKVKYDLSSERLVNIEKALCDELKRPDTISRIKNGDSVAIGVGSRDIANLPLILKILSCHIKEAGGKPFIVPAMGSHGGATAEGQKAVLADLGVTENNIGIPVVSSMETVEVGKTNSGIPVHMDKHAYDVDCIIPVGRIKPHTDFRGLYESGLVKMITIGLGKQFGASVCHKSGFESMSENICEIAKVSIKRTKIIFGLGIIENAEHDTYRISAIPAERIVSDEPVLLEEAKRLAAKLPFNKVDILIINEMGKEISGTGVDTNIIGRSTVLGKWEPYAERIVVFDLTQKSHGNANGIGLADIITQRLYDKIDLVQTYYNAITSTALEVAKMPVVMPTEEMAVKCAIKTCTGGIDLGKRIVILKNTLALKELYISWALKREAEENVKLEFDGEFSCMQFGSEYTGMRCMKHD